MKNSLKLYQNTIKTKSPKSLYQMPCLFDCNLLCRWRKTFGNPTIYQSLVLSICQLTFCHQHFFGSPALSSVSPVSQVFLRAYFTWSICRPENLTGSVGLRTITTSRTRFACSNNTGVSAPDKKGQFTKSTGVKLTNVLGTKCIQHIPKHASRAGKQSQVHLGGIRILDVTMEGWQREQGTGTAAMIVALRCLSLLTIVSETLTKCPDGGQGDWGAGRSWRIMEEELGPWHPDWTDSLMTFKVSSGLRLANRGRNRTDCFTERKKNIFILSY